MSTSSLLRRAALPLGLALLVSAAALAQDGTAANRPAPARPTTPANPTGPANPTDPATSSGPAVPAVPAVTGGGPAGSGATSGGAPTAGVATPAPKLRPNLSGTWRMDPKASDDPSKINERPGGPGGPGGGRGMGGGRGGAMGGRGGLSPDPDGGKMPGEGFDGSDKPEKERQAAEGRQAGREFGRLEIFHDGDEFDLTDGMQISRVLKIGGQPTDVFTPRGTMKAAATWEGDALVVNERNPDGRVMRTRQFMLSTDKQVLTVREVRHMPGKDGDATMTLVFRREQPGSHRDDQPGQGDHPDQGDRPGGKRGR